MGCRIESPTSPRARLAVVVSTLLLFIAPGTALAETAAVDEYSLGPIGDPSISMPDAQIETEAGEAPPVESLGIVGENAPAQSPLAAAGSSASGWIVAILALVLAAAAGLTLRAGLGRRTG